MILLKYKIIVKSKKSSFEDLLKKKSEKGGKSI